MTFSRLLGTLVLCVLIAGCSLCREVPGYFVQGRMTAVVNADGELVQRSRTKSMRPVTLQKPGEVISVIEGEVLDLNIPVAIDLGRYSLSVVPSATAVTTGSKVYDIMIERNCVPRILVNRSCQKLNWYNPYVLPEVVVENKRDQQLVYTPLYNPDTVMIGYEIRLGDHEECGSSAFKEWKRITKKGAVRSTLRSSTKDDPLNMQDVFGPVLE